VGLVVCSRYASSCPHSSREGEKQPVALTVEVRVLAAQRERRHRAAIRRPTQYTVVAGRNIHCGFLQRARCLARDLATLFRGKHSWPKMNGGVTAQRGPAGRRRRCRLCPRTAPGETGSRQATEVPFLVSRRHLLAERLSRVI